MSSKRNEQDQSLRERAALYLSGAMSYEEREAFELTLATDPRLGDAVRALGPAIETLADACAPVDVDQDLREAVLRAACSQGSPGGDGGREIDERQRWKAWDADDQDALYTLRANEGEWASTGVEGVEVRRLFVDRANNRMTGMFRMQPGTQYPSHHHDGAEECMVLEGDLHVGDNVLTAGDYQRAPAGSHHVVQWTEGGCVLLVTSSLSDELTP